MFNKEVLGLGPCVYIKMFIRGMSWKPSRLQSRIVDSSIGPVSMIRLDWYIPISASVPCVGTPVYTNVLRRY